MTKFELKDFKVNDIVKASNGTYDMICQICNINNTRILGIIKIYYNIGRSSKKISFDLINDYFQIIHNFGNMSFEEFKEQYPEEFI